MIFVKHDGGSTVLVYPYSYAQCRKDNPGVVFPREPSDLVGLMAQFNTSPVIEQPRPAYDPAFNIVEVDPVLTGDEWVQTWASVPASAEEIEQRASATKTQERLADAIADSFIPAFMEMTPVEVNNYIDNNTANLAQTRALLKKMALMHLAAMRLLLK